MQNRILTFLMLLGVIGLTACASPDTSVGRFKVGKPYRVGWHTYYPEENYTHTDTGIASWYGPGFNGKKTASGERFDENELTAAHKTLQLPSLVRVTNLENGKAIVVRVTDRGPFHGNRIIDLSKRAAELLEFKNKGVAKVKIQVLGPESMAIAKAAKQKIDTRGAEVAVNNTGMLDERFASFYEPGYLQQLEAQNRNMQVASAEGLYANDAIQETAPPAQASYQPQPGIEQQIAWNQPAASQPQQPDNNRQIIPPAPQWPPQQATTGGEPAITRTRAGGARHPGIPVAMLEPEDLLPPASASMQPVHAEIVPIRPSSIYVQAGSFASQPNAQKALRDISGLGPSKIVTANLGGKPYYRVRIGPIESVEKADALVNTLERAGRQASIVVTEN